MATERLLSRGQNPRFEVFVKPSLVHSAFSRADLEDEWLEIDVERDARVVRDGGRVAGYGGCASEASVGLSRAMSTLTRLGVGSGS
jgi:hypothetical protein